jgi:acyl-CoA synthetase (AMP-forming)/AMP-acid ligase II
MSTRVHGGAACLARHDAGTVAFVGLNGPAFALALFASAVLGRPFAPLNYRLSDEELRSLLARTAPSVAVVDDEIQPRVRGIPGVQLLGRTAFDVACRAPASPPAAASATDSEIAVLLFTSGTTGESKAAVLRHRNLSHYVISTVDFMGATEEEAALVSVPPYHIAGVSAVLTGVYCGRRIVHLPVFSPEAWIDVAAGENITHAMLVPTMLGRILDVLEQRGESLPKLRSLSYGGGRMPQATIERALRVLPHVDFTNAYGLTETSSTIAMLAPEDHREAITSNDLNVRRRLGSVGCPLPDLELQIRGSDGQVVPTGISGEIYVRGDQVAGEYLYRNTVMVDGWFATRDGGWIDEGGYLYVEGRLDDVIVRGGENISPGEVEDVLREHPNVADVAVFGIPDNEWGEQIAAVIVPHGPNPPVEELSSWVKGRLRSTRTPQLWEFCAELPYNDTGKLMRRHLKAKFWRRSVADRGL